MERIFTNLSQFDGTRLIELFKNLDKEITIFGLRNNQLGNYTNRDLEAIFKLIFTNKVIELDLSENRFGEQKSSEEFARIVETFRSTLNALNLSRNQLNQLDLSKIFSALPKKLTELRLDFNNLGEILDDFSQAFAKLPRGLLHLSLYANSLKLKKTSHLVIAFKNGPHNLQSLDLGANGLGIKPADELKEIIASLPNLISLELDYNELGRKKGAEVADCFLFLPKSLRRLSLYSNQLGQDTITPELPSALAAIPEGVIFLDLGNNNFAVTDSDPLSQAMAVLPPSINSLNLRENDLATQGAGLKKIFSSLPPTINKLDLTKNNLDKLSLEQLQDLAGSLAHIRKVYLSHKEIEAMSSEKIAALNKVFPGVERVILKDEEGLDLGNNLLAKLNFARKYDLSVRVPSLFKQSCFFIKKNPQLITDSSLLPQDLNFLVKVGSK